MDPSVSEEEKIPMRVLDMKGMPDTFIEGWKAGGTNAAVMELRTAEVPLTVVPDHMRLNPYDGRSRDGKYWKEGFCAAIDAFQGQFHTIVNHYLEYWK